jgi:tetratricopeptide (TPR) repeat protein
MRKSSVVRRVGEKVRTAGCVACAVCLLFLVVNAQDQAQIEFFEQVASLIRDNRLAEAEKDLSAVLIRSPEQPVALNFMGTIRAKQSRFLEAETLFNRALRNDKSFTAPRMNLVYLYLLKHTPDKAIVQLREVLTIEPDNAEAMERLPELLLSQGRIDECITFIEKRKAAGPIPASQLVLLGDAYLEKKSLQQAEDNYLLALEGRLDNAGALFGLAQISRLKGETKEAAIYLNRVATLISDSNSPELLYKFSMEAMRIGLFDQAKSALERSLAIKPKRT